MLSTNITQETTRIQRLHLQERLQRRAKAAQANPDLLTLLASEAKELGIELEAAHQQPGGGPSARLDRTLSALHSLRVDHS